MQAERILNYLSEIARNNSREWFHENKKEYDFVRKSFEQDIEKAILKIGEFDATVAHLTLKDVTYRFNRDTRFSPDKSPYKRHFGAYIAAHGKKSLHGGYYIHLEPGHCMVCVGTYWLPTNILTACRNEIMTRIDEWRAIVENRRFVSLFGRPSDVAHAPRPEDGGEYEMVLPKGFGITHLKSAPSGFPRDYKYIEYLRMKDYCCWKSVPDTFFAADNWIDEAIKIFQVGRPMMDFINAVVDDYE